MMCWNKVDCIGLLQIMHLYLTRTVLSANIQVTAYPGFNQRYLVLYTEKLPFLDAKSSCSVNQYMIMSGPFYQPPLYIKSEIIKHQWDSTSPNLKDGIWMGAVKLENSDVVINQDLCEIVEAAVNTEVLTSQRQCIYLNLSTTNDIDNNFYASSCDVARSYVCLSREIQDVRMFRNTTFEEDTPSQQKVNMTEKECQDMFLSSMFQTYAAEFTRSGDCKLFKTAIKNLPKNISLISDVSDSDIIMKAEKQVVLNTSSIGLSSNDASFPCITLSTTVLPQTTNNDKSSVLPNSTNPDTVTLEDEDCECYCTVNDLNKTNYQIQKEIEEIRNTLTLDKTTLTTYKRRKNSAYDGRTSSQALGGVGIAVICTILAIIVAADAKFFIDFHGTRSTSYILRKEI